MKPDNYEKFFSEIEKTFIKEKITGDSGFVNLLSIKEKYFNKIIPFIKKELTKDASDFSSDDFDYIYEKLYTFFSRYLNETGTPFFANTRIHNNIYEKIYSDTEDVTLFWKTEKLYYVKSEASYKNLEIRLKDIMFKFDASDLKHQKANEKKELIFYLTRIEDKELLFKVRYKEQPQYNKLKKILNISDTKEIQKYIKDNYPNIENSHIIIDTNNFDPSLCNKSKLLNNIFINENKDMLTVELEFAPIKSDQILNFCGKRLGRFKLEEEDLNKAFYNYKKQNEIDCFIHKDAKTFLIEQLNLYFYNYFMNDLKTDFTESKIKIMQKVKKVASMVIEYIAKFENELKAIWEKPKFVRKSNYVLTLDKLQDNINIIEKLIASKEFELQQKEWEKLGFTDKDFNKNNILIKNIANGFSLNPKYSFLPIDTKYFKNLKWNILNCFNNLEDTIDGTLIKSDNWQALNTILPKFKDKIQTIYIDPPFNLGTNPGFSYKVNYKDANWITLLENRIGMAKDLLNNKGSIFVRCDYNGNMYVRMLLNKIFGEKNFRNEIIINKSIRIKTKGNKFPTWHDSFYFYSKNIDDSFFNHITVKREKEEWRSMDTEGESWEIIPKNMLNLFSKQNIKIDNHGNDITRAKIILGKEILPREGRRLPSQKIILDLEKKNRIKLNGNNNPQMLKPNEVYLTDNWSDIYGYTSKWNFQTENSEFGIKRCIDSSSVDNNIILDFFLGSGTTTAVAHKLGRKWLGVEMGEHFYEVIIPRMKKVLFYDKSGISKEKEVKKNYNSNNAGGFFKYYELEQYEETLAKCEYDNQTKELEQNQKKLAGYTFAQDQKMLDALTIDYKKETEQIDFYKLYPDIDIAETISNLTGKKIKKLQKNYAIFDNEGKEEKIIFNKITYDKYSFIKPLIWWKSQ